MGLRLWVDGEVPDSIATSVIAVLGKRSSRKLEQTKIHRLDKRRQGRSNSSIEKLYCYSDSG
jgi:hypothetical protein